MPSATEHQGIYNSADHAEIGTFGSDRHVKQRRHDVRSAQRPFVQHSLWGLIPQHLATLVGIQVGIEIHWRVVEIIAFHDFSKIRNCVNLLMVLKGSSRRLRPEVESSFPTGYQGSKTKGHDSGVISMCTIRLHHVHTNKWIFEDTLRRHEGPHNVGPGMLQNSTAARHPLMMFGGIFGFPWSCGHSQFFLHPCVYQIFWCQISHWISWCAPQSTQL